MNGKKAKRLKKKIKPKWEEVDPDKRRPFKSSFRAIKKAIKNKIVFED